MELQSPPDHDAASLDDSHSSGEPSPLLPTASTAPSPFKSTHDVAVTPGMHARAVVGVTVPRGHHTPLPHDTAVPLAVLTPHAYPYGHSCIVARVVATPAHTKPGGHALQFVDPASLNRPGAQPPLHASVASAEALP
jgi:hypothetical protein